MGGFELGMSCVWAEAPASKAGSEFLVRLLSRVLTAGMSPCSLKQLSKWSWREELACGLAQVRSSICTSHADRTTLT